MTPRKRYSRAMQAARADYQWAVDKIKAHRKQCSRCNEAIRLDQYAATCDLGWQLLKYERRSAARLRALEADETRLAPVQLALF